MKYINITKKVLKLPFAIPTLPIVLIVLFFATDWEDEYEVNLSKKFLKTHIW